MSRRIAELNETHPLNVNAAECLQGYPWEPREQLAAVVLVLAHSCSEPRPLPRGAVSDAEVLRVFERMDNTAVDPDAVMDFISHVGNDGLDPRRLRWLDGDEIAWEIMSIVRAHLALGSRLPRRLRRRTARARAAPRPPSPAQTAQLDLDFSCARAGGR